MHRAITFHGGCIFMWVLLWTTLCGGGTAVLWQGGDCLVIQKDVEWVIKNGRLKHNCDWCGLVTDLAVYSWNNACIYQVIHSCIRPSCLVTECAYLVFSLTSSSKFFTASSLACMGVWKYNGIVAKCFRASCIIGTAVFVFLEWKQFSYNDMVYQISSCY